MNNPFAKVEEETKLDSVDVEAEEAEEEEVDNNEPDDEDETEEVTDETGKKTRRRLKEKNAKRRTPEQKEYIIKNYKDKTAEELMKDPFLEGLTRAQIVNSVKEARNDLLEQAKNMDVDKAEKVRAWVEENLPKRSAPRGAKKSHQNELMINDIISNILGD